MGLDSEVEYARLRRGRGAALEIRVRRRIGSMLPLTMLGFVKILAFPLSGMLILTCWMSLLPAQADMFKKLGEWRTLVAALGAALLTVGLQYRLRALNEKRDLAARLFELHRSLACDVPMQVPLPREAARRVAMCAGDWSAMKGDVAAHLRLAREVFDDVDGCFAAVIRFAGVKGASDAIEQLRRHLRTLDCTLMFMQQHIVHETSFDEEIFRDALQDAGHVDHVLPEDVIPAPPGEDDR